MSEAAPRRDGALGIIAGRGALPRLVAEAERRQGREAFVVALKGFADDWVDAWPSARAGLGQVGRVFGLLKSAGCRQVCFAGGVDRPPIFKLTPDVTAFVVLPKMLRLIKKGDDGLMRGLAAIFEDRGFEMVGAHELLGDQVAPRGAIGGRGPSAEDLEDLARAAVIVDALGAVDVGQGAVVAQGRCLAVETVQGTDAMLTKLHGDRRRGGAAIPSGLLYKAPKPGQDLRMDMPAIGPETMRRAKEAGLNGVAVRAGGVIILGVEETAREADAQDVFLYGWEPTSDAAGREANS